MNKTSNLIVMLMAVSLSLGLYGCGGGGGSDDSSGGTSGTTSVDPTDANALTAVLEVPGGTNIDGPLPSSSPSPDSPTITRSEENISYSPGTQILLPVDYQANNANISSVVFAVSGADSYYQVPLSGINSSGTAILPINLPTQVSNGQFCVDVKLIDSNGLVGAEQTICVTVQQPLACDTTRVSGGEGLTSTLHTMGGTVGSVRVDYQTYTVKDKIDVFQNGQWITGTGPATGRSTIRTALDCNQATEALGYVGANDEFVFNYDPSLGGDVEIVVSGCENNGTAWEYTASCPGDLGLMCVQDSDCQAGEACVDGTCVGEGVLRFSLSWSSNTDFDLNVITPDSSRIYYGSRLHDGGELDVDDTNGGSGSVENIFFNDTLLSGTYQFYVDHFSGEAGSFTIRVYEQGVLVDTRTGNLSSGQESTHYTYTYTP